MGKREEDWLWLPGDKKRPVAKFSHFDLILLPTNPSVA